MRLFRSLPLVLSCFVNDLSFARFHLIFGSTLYGIIIIITTKATYNHTKKNVLTEDEMETMNERHTCTLKPNTLTHAHTSMPFNQTHVKKENAHQKLKSKTEIKREKKN